jgi:hypothetical protein
MASRGDLGFCMKAFSANQTAIGRCAVALCFVVVMMSGSAAFAQTTGSVDSSPAEPPTKEDAPSGGCMPIGLTASGKIVFPIQCKEFIERARGNKTSEQQPAFPKDKPTGDKEREAEAPARSEPSEADKLVEPSGLRERVEPKHRLKKADDRTRYRAYDKASETYEGYDG